MITKTIKAYYCEYCKKFYRSKSACKNHELICWDNPVNHRDCRGCSYHRAKQHTVYYSENGYKEVENVLMLSYCYKHKMFIYPPKVEIKKNWFDTDSIPNVPMRKTCNDRVVDFEISHKIDNNDTEF